MTLPQARARSGGHGQNHKVGCWKNSPGKNRGGLSPGWESSRGQGKGKAFPQEGAAGVEASDTEPGTESGQCSGGQERKGAARARSESPPVPGRGCQEGERGRYPGVSDTTAGLYSGKAVSTV